MFLRVSAAPVSSVLCYAFAIAKIASYIYIYFTSCTLMATIATLTQTAVGGSFF